MKLSKSAAGILSARYKSVLIKCLLANLMLFSLPAAAEDITIKDGDYIDEFFDGENITISGGTFTNSSFNSYGDLIINGGKIEGTLSVDEYPAISIAGKHRRFVRSRTESRRFLRLCPQQSEQNRRTAQRRKLCRRNGKRQTVRRGSRRGIFVRL